MADATLFHNPRCSKSRAAHRMLEEAEVAFDERRYLDDPPKPEELRELQRMLGLPPRQWCRHKEAAFAEAGLSDDSSDEDILAAMAQFPVLIERPIFIRSGKAVIGRPPENIRTLLS